MAEIRAQRRPATLRTCDLPAVEALFQGDPARAAVLAAKAASLAPDRLARARALAAQATALAASGDPLRARTCLTKATRLAPDLHRLTTVRVPD